MSLTALAVVNRQGAPLYMQEYTHNNTNGGSGGLVFNLTSQLGVTNNHNDDIFGDDLDEVTTSSQQTKEWPCSLEYQFILHSAIQRLEEMIVKDNQWKANNQTNNACWVGILCTSNNLRAYGYITTNTRYVALVEDSRIDNAQLLKARDGELCVLMANVHRAFTDTLLNPFTTLNSKITSERFEKNVSNIVRKYNGHSSVG